MILILLLVFLLILVNNFLIVFQTFMWKKFRSTSFLKRIIITLRDQLPFVFFIAVKDTLLVKFCSKKLLTVFRIVVSEI